MLFKETSARIREKTLERASSIEQAAGTVYARLVRERRWFVVISAALSDFWEKKMYYFTGYFTYNAFLAFLALVIAVSAIVGFVGRTWPSTQTQIKGAMSGIIPIFGGTPKQATDAMIQYRNVIGVIGFFALLWTGTKIFGSLEWGFCQIWESKRRSFARGKLIGLVMVTAIGVVFIVSLAVQFAFAAVWGWMVGKEGAAFTAGTAIVKPLIGLAVNFLLFWFIYQVVPTVKQSLKRSAVGAIISAVFFLGIQYVLAFYFGHISHMPSVYGSVTTVVVLILWLHITGMIIFLGAEIIHAISDEELVEAHRQSAKLPRLFKSSVVDKGKEADEEAAE
jgi:YihY family inner membrane protein